MNEDLAELCRLLEQNRPSAPSIGYPRPIRDRVGRWALDLNRSGQPLGPVAARLGICRTTLRGWVEAVAVADSPAALPSFQPVAIVSEPVPAPSPAPTALVLVSPFGYRLEGLDLDAALTALARLR